MSALCKIVTWLRPSVTMFIGICSNMVDACAALQRMKTAKKQQYLTAFSILKNYETLRPECRSFEYEELWSVVWLILHTNSTTHYLDTVQSQYYTPPLRHIIVTILHTNSKTYYEDILQSQYNMPTLRHIT